MLVGDLFAKHVDGDPGNNGGASHIFQVLLTGGPRSGFVEL